MSEAITITRKMNSEKYADVLDAADYHTGTYGSAANAIAQMVRESKLYTQWRKRKVPKPPPADSKATR